MGFDGMQSVMGTPANEKVSPVGSIRTQGEASTPSVYEFGPFRLDPANRLLTGAEGEVRLSGRAFDALLLLVTRPNALVTKEELMASVWSGSFVEESNLTVAISSLRRALGDDHAERRYIQTVSKRGYRFVAPVRELSGAAVVPPEAAEPVAARAAREAAVHAEAASEGAPRVRPSAARRNWPLLVLIGLLLVALFGAGWRLLKPRTPIRSLAVLPFASDGQAMDEVALLGMTDGLISQLDNDLEVRPTSSVLRYSVGKAVDPVAAGREQGVDAVLTGEFRQVDGRTRLQMRLFRIRDGLVLWQDSFSGASFSQAEQQAVKSIAVELHSLGAIAAPQAVAARAAHPDDPAYQLYLRGRYFWNRRTVDGLRKSAEYFRQSIDADPNYAPAYAGLADSYALLASFSVEPGRTANADARSAALSAIQLDPTLAEPHASLGMIYFFTDWNLNAADREFERSIQLNPNYATAHHWYALTLAAQGRTAQSLYEIQKAQRLDPVSLIIGTNVGWIEYLARDYGGATRDLHRVLELDPNFARARMRLGTVEMASGDTADAVKDLEQALALSEDEQHEQDPWVLGLLGDAEARAGNRAGAEKVLSDLGKIGATRYVPPISRALVLLGLGRKVEAMAALEQAVDDHSTSMVYARVDPVLDPVRTDPAFAALLVRSKL